MADFAFGAFASFFMQSPSFLAHQRHLETGQGRSNCETLFGMRKIPGDGQIRANSMPSNRSCFTRCSPISWPNLSKAAVSKPCAASMNSS